MFLKERLVYECVLRSRAVDDETMRDMARKTLNTDDVARSCIPMVERMMTKERWASIFSLVTICNVFWINAIVGAKNGD